MVARIQALLRRFAATGPGRRAAAPAPLRIGECEIDLKRFQLRRGQLTCDLTARETKILELLHAHPGEVFSRDRLLTEVWGYHYHGTTRTLDQVIVQLRRKLGDNGEKPRHLLTVHGVAYKLAL